MNHSGDAAEQIVRMGLEGVEVAAKITGSAAKEIALLLIAALKNNDKDSLKLKGKARLGSMLKSGKPLEIISIRERDLAKFSEGAKEYGIVYCVLRNSKNNPDGLCDIMVKADDAPKISRLIERFEFATVDRARIDSEIAADKTAKTAEPKTGKSPERLAELDADQEPPDVYEIEKLLDDLLGSNEGKAKTDMPEPEKAAPVKTEPLKTGRGQPDSHPLASGGPEPGRTNPSAPTSDTRKKPEKTITNNKPSVKEEIREIKAARRQEETDTLKSEGRAETEKPKKLPTATTHQQPQRNKSKSTKPKGAR